MFRIDVCSIAFISTNHFSRFKRIFELFMAELERQREKKMANVCEMALNCNANALFYILDFWLVCSAPTAIVHRQSPSSSKCKFDAIIHLSHVEHRPAP